jgi:hypothetical protein
MKMRVALWTAAAKLPLSFAHRRFESKPESGSSAAAVQSAFGAAILRAETQRLTEIRSAASAGGMIVL